MRGRNQAGQRKAIHAKKGRRESHYELWDSKTGVKGIALQRYDEKPTQENMNFWRERGFHNLKVKRVGGSK